MLALLPPAQTALRRLRHWFGPRKVPVLSVACALALVILALAAGSKMNAQAALFDAALHPTQAEEVERALLIWNEPFTTDAEHTHIYVAASRRRDMLLRLALAGLPHRYVPTSSDMLEQTPSAFAPQAFLNDQRRAGIEGDLISSLRAMRGIEDATVVIAPSVDDPLSGDSSAPPSASVQLLMQPGAGLTQTQIAGIKRFVAASYPGLAAERVVVVDSLGADASAGPPPDLALSKEARLQNSVQSALDAVFGEGATIVRVTLRTSGEERSSQRTLVTPHGLLEAERGSENGSESGKNFTKERTHTRYAYDTVVETRAAHADALEKVSVAVFVDASVISLNQSKLITEVVRAAAGADLTNDQVVVAALRFRGRAPALLTTPGRSLRLRYLAPLAIVAAGMAAWFGFFAQRLPRPSPEDRAASSLRANLEHELPQTVAYVLSSLPANLRERVLSAYEPEQRQRIVAHLDGRTRT